MIELLNNRFGIDNTISIPILVSLIVFITGLIFQLFYKAIRNFYSRKLIRNSFIGIISEISRKCKLNASYIEIFYKTFNIEFNKIWTFKTVHTTYLELVYMQDYIQVFNAFNKLFSYKFKQKIGSKAFHKIWSILESLKFIEKQMHIDFKTFNEKLNIHEFAFNSYLTELQKLNDACLQPYIGKAIKKSDFKNEKLFNHLISRDQIIRAWRQHDIKTRNDKFVIYNKIIKPLRELNFKNQDLEITLELNIILNKAKHEYKEIVNLISTYSFAFYNYYRNYRSSFKVLNKCLEIIK